LCASASCAFSARSPALTHPETVGQTLWRNWDAIAILYSPGAAAAALREQLRYAKLGQLQPGLPFLGPKERREPWIGLLPQPFSARFLELHLPHVPGDRGASQREHQRRCRRSRNHAQWACPREKPIADVLRLLFVVDRNGVPSLGRRVDLKRETDGRDEREELGRDHDDE
jgi:hypothetical protein